MSEEIYENGETVSLNGHCQYFDCILEEFSENGNESSGDNVSSAAYEDLLGDVPIYNLWKRKFGKDNENAEQFWLDFRQDAVRQYDAFENRLRQIEGVIASADCRDSLFDIKCLTEKKDNINDVYSKLTEYEEELDKLSKLFGQFSQYLSPGCQRKRVDDMIRDVRRRFFIILQNINRKQETFMWVIPRMQRYKASMSDFKAWINTAQSRSSDLFPKIHDSDQMSKHIKHVEELAIEVHERKEVYEQLMASAKEILCINHNMKVIELQEEREFVEGKWDSLCNNVEDCVNKVAMEREAMELQNKSEMEKIHIKIQQEMKRCTCFSTFRIVKVDEVKYTFGASKTVRLLRIHGNSVVVRVGGGWEYLYNFLLKVDPCRAKLHSSPGKNVDVAKLSALSLTSLDKSDEVFNVTVQRTRKMSVPNGNLMKSPLISTSSKGGKELVENEEGNSPRKTKNLTRRYSLVERQSQYAQKQRGRYSLT